MLNINDKFMPLHPLKTAVLLLVFNRLETTKHVFEAIREAKPPRLYIASDGARKSKGGEWEKIKAVRDYLTSSIDWKCELKTLFREQNLGCKLAPSGAIEWFFKNEDMGIILEDDCVPSKSFFWFCEELLEKYQSNNNIFLISGDGRGAQQVNMNYDYDFTKYSLTWGWASWSRVWNKYDVGMSDWCENKAKFLDEVSEYKSTKKYWATALQNTYDNRTNAWDFQFSYLLLKNKGLCIVPRVNMISNIGFGVDATHTTRTYGSKNSNENIPRFNLQFPIHHPPQVGQSEPINRFYELTEFKSRNVVIRVINKISRMISGKNII